MFLLNKCRWMMRINNVSPLSCHFGACCNCSFVEIYIYIYIGFHLSKFCVYDVHVCVQMPKLHTTCLIKNLFNLRLVVLNEVCQCHLMHVAVVSRIYYQGYQLLNPSSIFGKFLFVELSSPTIQNLNLADCFSSILRTFLSFLFFSFFPPSVVRYCS